MRGIRYGRDQLEEEARTRAVAGAEAVGEQGQEDERDRRG